MDNGPIPFPSRVACLAFAKNRYTAFETRCGHPFLPQAVAIADWVDMLLTDHFIYVVGLVLPPQKLEIDSAYCGGLLHPILYLEPHACFETIADLANLDTARLIGTITPDCRLPRPQRHQDLVGRLYDASLSAQVVKFSELQVQFDEVAAACKGMHRTKAKQLHRDWLVQRAEILAALRKVREDESLATMWDRLHDELSQLVRTCDTSARRDKIRANIAQSHATAHRRNSASA